MLLSSAELINQGFGTQGGRTESKEVFMFVSFSHLP